MPSDKEKRKKSIRVAQRQNMKLRFVIAAGTVGLLTLLLILYFNLTRNEVMKAKENEAKHISDLPDSFKVEQLLIMPQQPEMRGISYKSIREEKDFINQNN
jgi:hypothetical protein